MSDDPYVYPGTSILKNRFGLTSAVDLDRVERLQTANRSLEPIPRGSFDLVHLRTVEISKGSQQFQFRQYIQTGMADVHRRLVRMRFLKGLPALAFAEQAAIIIGDVNYIHPFREGNDRTQLQYLKQLTDQAGHRLNLAQIEGRWCVAASQSSHSADCRPTADAIAEAMKNATERR